jgi:curved DNA-binding protein CbpA
MSFTKLRSWTATAVRSLWLVVLVFVSGDPVEAKPQDAIPSTLLKVHRMYTRHPPHDSTLYETLRVSPNATSAEILKSFRRLSRHHHPDKQQQQGTHEANEQFQKLQEAFEVLQHDSTRLLYHRYGLHNVATAVLILTGYQNSPKIPPPEQIELMQLMGYHHFATGNGASPPLPPPRISEPDANQNNYPNLHKQQLQLTSYQDIHNQRVRMLAATTLERLRPLAEGTLSEAQIADAVASECDRLKKLPLGAQILRCVGRAYRHAGQGFLKQLQRQQHDKKKWTLRDQWHDAKHVLTAVVASGQVVWNENWLLKAMKKQQKQQQQVRKHDKAAIDYHNNWDGTTTDMVDWLMDDHSTMVMDDDGSSDDDQEAIVLNEEELQQQEILKAQKIMVELSQIEALWKVHKIGLDRAVREACMWILTGRHFFFPSHQYPNDSPESVADPWQQTDPSDGWVSEDPKQPWVIDAQAAQCRAAGALVLIGNVMVQSSKQGTAWLE